MENRMNKETACFIAGTKIYLTDGETKNIEDIVVGDEVTTFDHSNDTETTMGIVGELKQHEVSSVIKLTFESKLTEDYNGETPFYTKEVTTTEDHMFFVTTTGLYTPASELVIGNLCFGIELSEMILVDIEIIEQPTTVYNLLNVAQQNNYFANGILVHNKN